MPDIAAKLTTTTATGGKAGAHPSAASLYRALGVHAAVSTSPGRALLGGIRALLSNRTRRS